MNTQRQGQEVCPTCKGDKIIPGACECDSEWRGSDIDDKWAECHCTPDVPCPTCKGDGSAQVKN